MKTRRWLALVAMAFLAVSGKVSLADGHGKGHGKGNGHWRDKQGDYDDDDDRRGYGFAEHDRDEIRGWYAENYRHLPPGLAKRDRLPPGLERQLVVRGELPPGLRGRIEPVPVSLENLLPPPPPDCERVVIGGHLVLMNRHTNIVLDIFHFE